MPNYPSKSIRTVFVFHRLIQKNMRIVISVTAFPIRQEYSAFVDG